jgi:non-haem Fe2+, alpha-ketoglutarate-dependent halogenase
MTWDDDVSKLDRELKFFPVKNNSPEMLTTEQIDFYNEKGYLFPLKAFNQSEAEENRSSFDRILERFIKSGKSSYAIDRYQDSIAEIWDLAKNNVIVGYVKDLLGPNVVCWATHYFCKLPGDDKGVSWHQDASYWPLTPSKTVTVWLAVDDADVENGCMQVIPGSHKQGHIKFTKSKSNEKNILSQTVEDPLQYGDAPVNVELNAGEFSLHSDLLLHSSPPNKSNRRRCGLTLRYAPVDVRTYWNWSKQSIIVSGTDPSGHWADVPRPEGDFVIKDYDF